MDGQKDGDLLRGKKEPLTAALDKLEEEKGESVFVEGDLTWSGETFLFHVQPLSIHSIHSWLLLVLCS